jgi:hypothetical protein
LPRLTGDLDAWVRISDDNARVIRALTDLGFGSLGLTADDFNRPDSIVQLGDPPYRIDILTEIDASRSTLRGIATSRSRSTAYVCRSSVERT